LDASFEPNYTNNFLSWKLEGDSADPISDQKRMVELQKNVALKGGFQRLEATPVPESLQA
jgi:pyrimidine precursor biosynthesis enzyme